MTKKLPCYHVTTSQGETYGVAATSVKDAMSFVQERLNNERTQDPLAPVGVIRLLPAGDKPVSAKRVATWEADYGTVLHY